MIVTMKESQQMPLKNDLSSPAPFVAVNLSRSVVESRQ